MKGTTKSLRYNFFSTMVGNVIYSSCQWGLLMTVAKLGSPYIVGQYTLGLAVTAPVFMLTNLQMREIQATDANNQFAFSQYFGLRIFSIFIALIICSFLGVFVGDSLETKIIILLVAVAKGADAMCDCAFGLLQKRELMPIISRSLIYRGILALILFSMLFYWFNLRFALFGLILASIIVFLTYDLKNAAEIEFIRPKFDILKFRDIIKTSLPLAFVVMIMSLNANIPRYYVDSLLGKEALGYFAAMLYTTVAGTTIVSALGQTVISRLARYHTDRKRTEFVRLFMKLMFTGLFMAIAAWLIVALFGPTILTVLYRHDYAQFTREFELITISAGCGFLSAFIGNALTAMRDFRLQPWITIGATLIGVAIFEIYIPQAGLQGAALGLVSAGMFQCVGLGAALVLALRKSKFLREEQRNVSFQ